MTNAIRTAATQEQINAAIDWATSMRAAGCADAYAKTYDGNVDGKSVKILRGVECYMRDAKSGTAVVRTVTDWSSDPAKVIGALKKDLRARIKDAHAAARSWRDADRS